WSWAPFDALKFLPRLRSGRLILAPARWRLDASDLATLQGVSADEAFVAVARLRAARGLPRFVLLADFDNELTVDLDNALSVDAFVHVVRRRDSVVLIEALVAADTLCVAGPEGRFAHEL